MVKDEASGAGTACPTGATRCGQTALTARVVNIIQTARAGLDVPGNHDWACLYSRAVRCRGKPEPRWRWRRPSTAVSGTR
ncbi:hypothetical protein KCP73_06575 [Salmonella enterica subsp. enterica]|nr:hypothetical protein KCP73_06575 [Salmonella enterica subsp. enterica]